MTPKQLLKYIQRIKVELAKEVGRINSKLEAINKNDHIWRIERRQFKHNE